MRDNFSGTVYVATPALLAGYGIKQNQIGASTDILTMRPGLAAEPDMQLTSCLSPPVSGNTCPAATISDPVMQTFGSLPSGTSAPNTVLTMLGLIRSESAGDLRTLAATGASGLTRRTITSATAGRAGAPGWLLAGRQPPLISRQPLE